jgi:8-oxo-dGTP pyrophosphatase MutT (NUDIX family)
MTPISFSEKIELFANKYLSLYSVNVNFGDFCREYTVVKGSVRGGVILQKDGSILLVKQYRYAINSYSWELPSGGIDREGEGLEEAVIRECLEETGIRCRNLTPIFEYIAGVDTIDSPAHIYVSNDFEEEGDFDHQEISEIKWVPYRDCLDMVLSGEVKDIFTIIGFFIYGYKYHMLLRH